MWIHIPTIESSTCSPDTAASRSASGWPDSIPPPSATSSGTSTARRSYNNVSGTDCSTMLPSLGETSEISTGDPGVDAWICWWRASHVNLTAWPGREKLPEDCLTIVTSGPIRSESLARWEVASSSWRTSQACWQMETGQPTLESLSGGWPQSGMTRSGCLFRLPKPERPISENGGGLWPTPNASSGGTHSGISEKTAWSELAKGHQIGLGAAAAMWPTPRAGKTTDENEESWLARYAAGKVATPPLALAARMWPTPTSTERSGTNPKTGKGEGLSKTVKMLPTPRASEYKGSGPVGSKSHTHMLKRDYLCAVVKMLPTPTSTERPGTNPKTGKGEGLSKTVKMLPTPTVMPFATPSSSDSVGSHGGGQGRSLRTDTHGEGGSLSPDWVSWLMGLPVGWTSLEPMPRREYLDWLHAQLDGTWWDEERGLPRVATGVKDRVNRLKCLGNGIVPASLALFLRRR
jgi:hypothetical protein